MLEAADDGFLKESRRVRGAAWPKKAKCLIIKSTLKMSGESRLKWAPLSRGPSTNDISGEGEKGWLYSDKSKGGCVSLVGGQKS